jgi:NitT/TauT family transport system substrate-binding protein
VRQISDLEGRRVGVMPQLSDLSSVLFKAAGVEGVKLLELRPEALISSLLEGKMDAVILLEPYRTEAIGRGAEVLCDAPLSRRVQSPFPGVGICTRGSFIEKEHRAGVRLHNALELSVGYIDRQPTQAREILAQALKTPKAKFEHILLPEFQRLSRIDQAAVQTFANRLASLEFLSPGLDSRLLLAEASQLR